MDPFRLTLRPVPVVFLLVVAPVCLTGCSQSLDSAPTVTSSAVEITTPTGVPMVLIPAGEFWMGSDAGESDAASRHLIQVSAFAMDKFEALQREFAALQMPDGSHFKGEDRPVEQIRWSDAALFCNARSRAEGLEPCYDEATFECDFEASGYRLPTEAEWEYAARAGTSTDYPFGNSPHKLAGHACYAGNSAKQTSRAGQKKPNAWGLHDMLGNVAEWCHDVYGETYYQESPRVDPRGPASGPKRVMRGGSWKSSEDTCTVLARMADVPGITDACFAQDTYGFRCVRRLSDEERVVCRSWSTLLVRMGAQFRVHLARTANIRGDAAEEAAPQTFFGRRMVRVTAEVALFEPIVSQIKQGHGLPVTANDDLPILGAEHEMGMDLGQHVVADRLRLVMNDRQHGLAILVR